MIGSPSLRRRTAASWERTNASSCDASRSARTSRPWWSGSPSDATAHSGGFQSLAVFIALVTSGKVSEMKYVPGPRHGAGGHRSTRRRRSKSAATSPSLPGSASNSWLAAATAHASRGAADGRQYTATLPRGAERSTPATSPTASPG